MKKPIFCTLLLASFCATGEVAAPAPVLPVASYVLMDFHTGEVLASHAAEKRVEPASLTKLMTAYIAFDELPRQHVEREHQVLVSKKAWQRGYVTRESRMFIDVGSRVPVTDLLHGLVIQSGNDAGVALAEHIAGSEPAFALRMNDYARRLGLDDSRFANATGISQRDHYSTALDMARLSRALIRDFPEDYKLFREREYTWNNIRQYNRNKLLARDPSVDGIKTGYHRHAGYCIATSAERGGRRLIAVVMGAKRPQHRTKAALALLNHGFQHIGSSFGSPEMLPVAEPAVIPEPPGIEGFLQNLDVAFRGADRRPPLL